MFSPRPDADAKVDSEVERLRQRAVTERMLIGALHAQDVARNAIAAEERAAFLAAMGRDLLGVIDLESIRHIVQRCTLPRVDSWSIVDVIDQHGCPFRLSVMHPDPEKQALARSLADRRRAGSPGDPAFRSRALPPTNREPRLVTRDSGDALIAAVQGPTNLEILRKIGFEQVLVIPLVVRDIALGAITFVTREGDSHLSAEEIALAGALADQIAFALDNARLYAQAEALRAEADAANRAKSVFLGNMTHELLTPLNAIGGYTDLMEMGLRGPITPEQRVDLERIKASQQHLIALIRGILEYVHSEAGRIDYNPIRVPVASLLNEIADMLHGPAAEKGLSLRVRRGGDDDAVVVADPVRVRQILTNLVMNAVKYSGTNSGPIILSTEVVGESVTISVSDSGPGIPADKIGTIFEPFVQLASGKSDRQGGIGLGLAISLDLARAMKGDLTVESTVGKGATFKLTLPRARKPG